MVERPASPARPLAALQRYGLLLVPRFSLIALSSVVDPLRLANSVLERPTYEWVTLGLSTDPVISSDGIRVLPDAAMTDGLGFDAVFVIGPNPIPRRGLSDIAAWLRRQAAQGVALGGVDTGSYFLARAGLLNGYRCTIHWEDREVLPEHFPQLIVSDRLFEIDRDRYTCSGGVSPLDMMIWLLSQPPGSRELAERVADLLVAQRRSRLAHVPAVVLDALQMMQSNLDELLDIDEIARVLALSRRQVERLFREHLGTSPSRKYLEIRLVRARLAVLRSTRSLDDIAQSCGFGNLSHFIARYRRAFASTPAADRAARPLG